MGMDNTLQIQIKKMCNLLCRIKAPFYEKFIIVSYVHPHHASSVIPVGGKEDAIGKIFILFYFMKVRQRGGEKGDREGE
jgi:hypothetical protein